jgi:iron complex outermembrane receptor protein
MKRADPMRVALKVDRSSPGVVLAATCAYVVLIPVLALAQQNVQPPGAGTVTLPEIHVIAPTPLVPPHRAERHAPARTVGASVRVRRATAPARARPSAPAPVETAAPAAVHVEPGVVERDKVPANIQTAGAAAFAPDLTPSLLEGLERALPGVALGSQTGNDFQRDFNYRGFVASPVVGTPQGLAVYQNGVRINEVFGDTVNWDFIPQNAISQMALVPSNPVYGLNAIGGALSFQMKNGFIYHGVAGEVSGGSFGRIGASVQAGGQSGNISSYVTADAIDDMGWRENSPSQLRRMYADVAARGDRSEYHLTFTAADNHFGALAGTPVQMLEQNWASIYTGPQTTHNQLAFLTASASWTPSDALTYQATAYYRYFEQAHVDGNVSNAQNSGCPDPAVLCFPNLDGSLSNLTTIGGSTVSASGALATAVLGEIDRTATRTNSFGGSAQMASAADLFGHGNNAVFGISIDRGLVQFASTSELGTISGVPPLVQGTGLFIDQPSGDLAPVGLGARTLYTGIYGTDTFDVTRRFALTAGGRFNVAQIGLTDEFGSDAGLNGSHTYVRFNPTIGGTYKLTPNVTAYANYSEANRAPTPLELGCADPARPCLIDSALVGDPSLNQVVSHTIEAGLRGAHRVAGGSLNWNIGAFRTENLDDIINVASPLIQGHQYFQNAGNTLRRGIEAGATYKRDRWDVYANYTYVDAIFLNALQLNNALGPESVVPGDHLAGIPDHRFKAGGEYRLSEPWKVGADLNVVGSQWLVGDEANRLPKVPAYWLVNAHTSYQLFKHVELFGLVRNLFNQHYDISGTLFEPGAIPYLNLTDPRSFVPGMPFAAYAGLRGAF